MRVKCRVCFTEQDADQFRTATTRQGKPYLDRRCKSCEASRSLEYYRRDPVKGRDRQRAVKLKMNYGLSIEQYDAMLATQDGKCAICSTTEPGGMGRFPVDHDHKTGKVRGLLCANCNRGIGNFRDDLDLIELAKRYLRASN